jgi:O-acetyl-ADP-ribose deacetylase (regulator of RNase III)
LTIIAGDATKPDATKPDATKPGAAGNKIIAHVANDIGAWGKGFVVAISRRWPEPEREFRRRYKEDGFELGAVQLVQVTPDIWVANMVGQHGIVGRHGIRVEDGWEPASSGPPIRYDAVRRALDTVAEHALRLEASVHMPRIGCGLAGGAWDRIEPLIAEALCAREVRAVIYDYSES